MFSTELQFLPSIILRPGQESGRAKGGLASLSKSSLDIRNQRVTTASWRIQAQVLHHGQNRLLWINCYFPCDTRQQVFDETEVQDVLREVETILDRGGFDDVICGGDFNYDDRRDTGFTRIV